MIQKEKMEGPKSVENVKREVSIMQALSGNENVVQFHEAFEDNDYVYILMEENGRYSEKDAAALVRQMLKVVALCHLKGIVHRDLKPENFLFKSKAENSPLKAADFGVSDYIQEDQSFRDVVGTPAYIAPEVYKRNSGRESDVWSIGVITYILLCGRLPFSVGNTYKKVSVTEPDYLGIPWPSLNSSAKDFVKNLIVTNPTARLTAAQALSHRWLREDGDATDIILDISVLSNLRKFVKYGRLKQIALRVLATTLHLDEIADLRDQFDKIDVDKNGTITFEDIRQVLEDPLNSMDNKVREILQAMDANGDGVVDFYEFVAAALHVQQLELNVVKWIHRTAEAFQCFDTDLDGFITPEDLKKHTGVKGCVKHLLDEAYTDDEGRIDIYQFRKLLRQPALQRGLPASQGV